MNSSEIVGKVLQVLGVENKYREELPNIVSNLLNQVRPDIVVTISFGVSGELKNIMFSQPPVTPEDWTLYTNTLLEVVKQVQVSAMEASKNHVADDKEKGVG